MGGGYRCAAEDEVGRGKRGSPSPRLGRRFRHKAYQAGSGNRRARFNPWSQLEVTRRGPPFIPPRPPVVPTSSWSTARRRSYGEMRPQIIIFATILQRRAFGVNLLVALAGNSKAVLSQAIYSLTDLHRLGTLVVGILRVLEPASYDHPFGYGKERYFWPFTSSLVTFTLAGGHRACHRFYSVDEPDPDHARRGRVDGRRRHPHLQSRLDLRHVARIACRDRSRSRGSLSRPSWVSRRSSTRTSYRSWGALSYSSESSRLIAPEDPRSDGLGDDGASGLLLLATGLSGRRRGPSSARR